MRVPHKRNRKLLRPETGYLSTYVTVKPNAPTETNENLEPQTG